MDKVFVRNNINLGSKKRFEVNLFIKIPYKAPIIIYNGIVLLGMEGYTCMMVTCFHDSYHCYIIIMYKAILPIVYMEVHYFSKCVTMSVFQNIATHLI